MWITRKHAREKRILVLSVASYIRVLRSPLLAKEA